MRGRGLSTVSFNIPVYTAHTPTRPRPCPRPRNQFLMHRFKVQGPQLCVDPALHCRREWTIARADLQVEPVLTWRVSWSFVVVDNPKRTSGSSGGC